MPSRRLNPKGAIPLRERLSLSEEWDSLAQELLASTPGLEADSTQMVETRRAFYAGATSMFTLMTEGLDEDHEPTQLDISYVSSLKAELDYFRRLVARGQA